MVKWPSGLYSLVWGILGFLLFLGGFVSGNIVTMVVGVTMAFANVSAFLTSHIKSENRVKGALEVIFGIITFGVIIYGYFVTGSLFLGVITLFMVAMVFFAFIVSYLLPKIRGKSKSSP